jgi:hypothetical protein
MLENIVEANVTPNAVRVKLESGVNIDVCSNQGYLYLNFAGIDIDQPIEIFNKAANQLCIKYKAREPR